MIFNFKPRMSRGANRIVVHTGNGHTIPDRHRCKPMAAQPHTLGLEDTRTPARVGKPRSAAELDTPALASGNTQAGVLGKPGQAQLALAQAG